MAQMRDVQLVGGQRSRQTESISQSKNTEKMVQSVGSAHTHTYTYTQASTNTVRKGSRGITKWPDTLTGVRQNTFSLD